MITIKSDAGHCNIQMNVNNGELVQNEIVNVMLSMLVSFKKQMESFGMDPKDIDKDVELMVMNAKFAYMDVKDNFGEFTMTSEIEEVLDDGSADTENNV